jgi:hypothetical protein
MIFGKQCNLAVSVFYIFYYLYFIYVFYYFLFWGVVGMIENMFIETCDSSKVHAQRYMYFLIQNAYRMQTGLRPLN